MLNRCNYDLTNWSIYSLYSYYFYVKLQNVLSTVTAEKQVKQKQRVSVQKIDYFCPFVAGLLDQGDICA